MPMRDNPIIIDAEASGNFFHMVFDFRMELRTFRQPFLVQF